MKRCAACRRVYDRDAAICPMDGTSLDDFSTDTLVGQTIAKRYRLARRLGTGSLGTVYLAMELATGKPVALKILTRELRCNDETLKQCRWDARFAAASHPLSIARVFEVDRTDDGQVFIAMEYVDGESLADVIHRDGSLALGRALRLASQIAQGLAAASHSGVTHHEIKPRNVMVVGPEERIKLTDFGIARLRKPAPSESRIGSGASDYRAPEQLAGGDAADRTDIYGLGAVLYAMVTGGAPPAAAGNLSEAPPPVRALRPDVPAPLEQLVIWMLEREPERRPNSMSEVAERLLDLTAAAIEAETAAEAPFAAPQRTPASQAIPRRDVASIADELASPRTRGQIWRPHVERWQRQRARLHTAWQTSRGRWSARREHWSARARTYRAAWHARSERARLTWHAHRERRQARRLRRRLAWQAYRAHWRARTLAWRERRHARSERLWRAWSAYRARRQARRARRRAAWQAYRALWRTRARTHEQQWRARWRLAWAAYCDQRQAGRARRRVVWQAYRTDWRTRAATWHEHRRARRERLWRAWSAYGARRRARRVRHRMAWETHRALWRARRRLAQARLAESSRHLLTIARRRRDGLTWARANRRALGSAGAAIVVTGVVGWIASEWQPARRDVAQPMVAHEPRDAGSGGELGTIELATRPFVAPMTKSVGSEARRVAASVPPLPVSATAPRRDRDPANQPDAAAPVSGVTARADASPDSPPRPAPPPQNGSRAAALSGPQIARIQAQAEQTLRGRGLLRVSQADRWGVALETAANGEVHMSGVLRDITLYDEAVRLVREIPGVKAVRGSVEVSDVGVASIAQSDVARIQAEIQQKLRSRGLLRESAADRWGVTVEVNPDGDVTLVGAVRDAEMSSEAVRRTQEVTRVRQVKQDIKVMDRDGER